MVLQISFSALVFSFYFDRCCYGFCLYLYRNFATVKRARAAPNKIVRWSNN